MIKNGLKQGYKFPLGRWGIGAQPNATDFFGGPNPTDFFSKYPTLNGSPQRLIGPNQRFPNVTLKCNLGEKGNQISVSRILEYYSWN